MSSSVESLSLSKGFSIGWIAGPFQASGYGIIWETNVRICTSRLEELPLTTVCTVEQARNLSKSDNLPLSIAHYLKNMHALTNQWNQYNYREAGRQRIYLKDIDCPKVWHDKLKEQIPPGIFYLNDSTGEIGGPGAMEKPNPRGPGTKKGRGAARSGDLMSCLPPSMRAENLMCYIGHEGTYTPAHREMCASLGQNIMVEVSTSVDQDGKVSKPGSSLWFMTETKDRHLVSEYWLSTLGHDIEVESHFAQINAWKAAPFTTYIVEQKVGDFILIPPLAPHQVWNRGTRTMKVAWNRTTVETLEMAIDEALPRARMVCRDEQYKNKAIVLFALQRYSGLLQQVENQKQSIADQQVQMDLTYSPKIRQLQKDFKRLFALYTSILLSEMLAPVSPSEKRGQYIKFDSNITCSYCRCNIFNRFLTCPTCIISLDNGEEDTYDVCMDCYAMGRSCRCQSNFIWVEQFPWHDLVEKYDQWRHQIISFEGGPNENSPQPLHNERKRMDKKTLAQICQEQLKIRPWRDPNKASTEAAEPTPDGEASGDDGKTSKRRKKRKSQKYAKDAGSCHICKTKDPKWKLARCDCGLSFCYGSLWRGFDIMPRSVMEDPNWKCPRCLKMCTCRDCGRDPSTRPFEPNGTVLGHDTKKVADARSIESLVDFSISNLHWVKKAGDDHPQDTRRLQRRRNEALDAKARDPALDDNYVDEENLTGGSSHLGVGQDGVSDQVPIDPLLSQDPSASTSSEYVSPYSNGRGSKGSHPDGTTNGSTKSTTLQARVRTTAKQGGEPMRQAAAEALRAMDEVGTLEADPKGFASAAGLSLPPSNDFSTSTGAPLAGMAGSVSSNGPNLSLNGISYEYPDPSSAETPTSHSGAQHGSQSLSLQNDTTSAKPGQKRKRADDRPTIQSDLPQSSANDANKQYEQAQLQRTLLDAKKKDRYISTEAAFSGKSRILKLRAPSSKLAAVEDALPERPSFGGDGPEDDRDVPDIVLSDISGLAIRGPPKQKTTVQASKTRRVRVESDDDYETIASLDNRGRRSSGKIIEISEDSEVNSDADNSTIIVEKQTVTSKTRALPAYLAQRSKSTDGEVPKELSYEPKARYPRKKAAEPVPNAAIQPSLENDLTPANGEASISTKVPVVGPLAKPTRLPELDPFAAEELPAPSPAFKLSQLGPGAVVPEDNDRMSTAEANRRAKLRAIQGPTEIESSSEESDDYWLPKVQFAKPALPTSGNRRGNQHARKLTPSNSGEKNVQVTTAKSAGF